jgi:hypothetical protein
MGRDHDEPTARHQAVEIRYRKRAGRRQESVGSHQRAPAMTCAPVRMGRSRRTVTDPSWDDVRIEPPGYRPRRLNAS